MALTDIPDKGGLDTILSQDFGLGVINKKSLPQGGNPKKSVLRLYNLLDFAADVYAILSGLIKIGETVRCPVIDIQSGVRSNPYILIFFNQCLNEIVLQ